MRVILQFQLVENSREFITSNMQKILLLVVLGVLVIGCKNEMKITPEVKAEILLELQQINEIDQKYAGIPPTELFEKYGSKKAWELFEASRDSVGLLNQEKIKLTLF